LFRSRLRRLLLLLAMAVEPTAGILSVPVLQAAASKSQLSAGAQPLDAVLSGMNQAASGFRNMMANLEYTKVTVIVDDHSTEKGRIYFEKSKGQSKGQSKMKTRVMIAFREPSEKYVLFSGDTVSIYRPKIAEVEEYKLADKKDLLEQFLLLGFGTAGADLQNAYRITLRGEEILDGRQVFHLELVPKSPKVAAQLRQIELWIAPATWQPVQQKFLEPSGDYALARYTELQQNTKIPGDSFKLPIRGKVKTVRPQGQ
jgi:outer membrane lipoprotein-sorting protein